jgi:putative ABC transport system ATP-binding protein
MDASSETQSPFGPPRLHAGGNKTGEPTLVVRDVNHYFGQGESRKQALFENRLVAYPGEMIIMTGPSGSGKTTLLTLIGALRSLQEGSLTFNGREYLGMPKDEQVRMRHGIGFIFQAHNLFESLTALENVRLATELVSPAERARNGPPEKLLEALGLGHRLHYKPANLSGGQRQRVAVARALINRPKLILADEPTAALDKESGRTVVNLIQSMCRDHGTTALIVTHDSRILDVANRIVNMVDGRVVSDVDIAETQELLLLLHGVSVFKDLPAVVLKEVAGKLQRESARENEIIFRQGAAGDKFYIIRSGSVEITIDDGTNTRAVATLGPGKFFGELALLRDQPRAATVRALTPLKLLTLTKPQFLDLVQAAPTMEEQIRKVYFAG